MMKEPQIAGSGILGIFPNRMKKQLVKMDLPSTVTMRESLLLRFFPLCGPKETFTEAL